jgi:hypothetical protein
MSRVPGGCGVNERRAAAVAWSFGYGQDGARRARVSACVRLRYDIRVSFGRYSVRRGRTDGGVGFISAWRKTRTARALCGPCSRYSAGNICTRRSRWSRVKGEQNTHQPRELDVKRWGRGDGGRESRADVRRLSFDHMHHSRTDAEGHCILCPRPPWQDLI